MNGCRETCEPIQLGCHGFCEEIDLDILAELEGEYTLELSGETIFCTPLIIDTNLVIPSQFLPLGKNYFKILQPDNEYLNIEGCEIFCINIKHKYKATNNEEVIFNCD